MICSHDVKQEITRQEEHVFLDGLSQKEKDGEVQSALLPRASAEKFFFSGLFFLGLWLLAE